MFVSSSGERYGVSDQRRSKFLSLVLRHKPELIGITLDEQGWVDIELLLQGLKSKGRPMTEASLRKLVQYNDKKRFLFSSDGRRIRAAQGHSVKLDMDFQIASPPQWLYHGTVEKFLASIFEQGLKPQKRHHVHLSADRGTAWKVGARRGPAIVLKVAAQKMLDAGHQFFISENGVWLVEWVPPEFLERV